MRNFGDLYDENENFYWVKEDFWVNYKYMLVFGWKF